MAGKPRKEPATVSRAEHPTTTRRRVLSPALSKAVLGIGLAAVLAGCGAGQITQTDTQLAGINGANGNAGPIALRDVQLAYPPNMQGVYAPGSNATLILTIVNTGLTPDTLVRVTSPAATSVLINDSATGTVALPGNFAVASGSDPDDSTITVPASATGSVVPSPLVSTSATSTPNGVGPPTTGNPAPSRMTIELVGLRSVNGGPLRAGMTIPITFFFAQAGQVTIGQVPIGAPPDASVVATPGSNG
jgi:copper(I)-binding protein